jgi:hypothetical protein
MTTYSQNDANNLHDSGKFYGQTVATLINQIYPQKNHCMDIDAAVM